MTEPTTPLNGELAWDLSEWQPPDYDQPMSRPVVEDLARFLTAKGYTKDKTGGIVSLLASLEDVGVRIADEVGPLIDSMRSRK